MTASQGNSDPKSAALTCGTVDLDDAAVQFDEFAYQGESDSRTLMRAPACPRHPVETIEELRQGLMRYPRSRVRDYQLGAAINGTQRQLDFPFEGILKGV